MLTASSVVGQDLVKAIANEDEARCQQDQAQSRRDEDPPGPGGDGSCRRAVRKSCPQVGMEGHNAQESQVDSEMMAF